MHLIISRLKFTHSQDSYYVESQDKDEGIAQQKKRALELLNTEEDKTFHLVTVIQYLTHMGHYVIMSHKQQKGNMQNTDTFFITYFARKHKKFITRKGQYNKPDGTEGKSFVSKNGNPCLVYWDLDNDGWRMATGNAKVRI